MLNKKLLALGLSLCFCFLLSSCKGKNVTVFAAASLEPVLTEIFDNYTKQTGNKVDASYAASGQLIMQLENGARADVFISAGNKQGDKAKEIGIVQESWPIVKNTLVMVWKNGSYEAINDVLSATTIAMGETETVPAGQYAKEALQSQSIYEQAAEKSVFLANVREVLTAVKSGNADVGFVYKTDAIDSELHYIEVPQKLYSQISYPLALLNLNENDTQGKSLTDYLFSQAAKAVFEEKGFTFVERNK